MLLRLTLETFVSVAFLDCRRACQNGSESFQLDLWVWPSDFQHYVADLEVRPSPESDRFIQEWAPGAAQPKV
jgi:hypothetical protein